MNAPSLNITPDTASLLAAIAKLDTLAQAELLSRAWEQMLAQCDDTEHDALSHMDQYGRSVSTFAALDTAWANLRDLREDERQSYDDPTEEWAADHRAGAL